MTALPPREFNKLVGYGLSISRAALLALAEKLKPPPPGPLSANEKT
jgi:hypothetical protein